MSACPTDPIRDLAVQNCLDAMKRRGAAKVVTDHRPPTHPNERSVSCTRTYPPRAVAVKA